MVGGLISYLFSVYDPACCGWFPGGGRPVSCSSRIHPMLPWAAWPRFQNRAFGAGNQQGLRKCLTIYWIGSTFRINSDHKIYTGNWNGQDVVSKSQTKESLPRGGWPDWRGHRIRIAQARWKTFGLTWARGTIWYQPQNPAWGITDTGAERPDRDKDWKPGRNLCERSDNRPNKRKSGLVDSL